MANMETETPSIPWPEDEPVIPLWPDAARPYKISRPKAYSLAQQGKFPARAFKVGNTWAVRTVDLREALGLSLCPPDTHSSHLQTVNND
jgi:hypothetical protein